MLIGQAVGGVDENVLVRRQLVYAAASTAVLCRLQFVLASAVGAVVVVVIARGVVGVAALAASASPVASGVVGSGASADALLLDLAASDMAG